MEGVLILNRRCIRHPEKGGAEIYTYHLAKALVEEGIKVEWFCSRPNKLKQEEKIENIKFIRKGNELTTHFYGFLYAVSKKNWLIIDEFNGVGFFSFIMKNSILLIHQIYDSFWTVQLGLVGYPLKIIEKIFLRLYRKKPTITVSPSTLEDLKNNGFEDINVIYNGLDIEVLNAYPDKKDKLAVVYLGRLKKTKNPEDAIKAFLIINKKIPNASLTVMGDGPLLQSLQSKYGKEKNITFTGFIDESKKYNILRESHFLLVPSIREGWGQVVIQANSVGTPAIGYNVKGLKDSILDGETGFIVEDYIEMAEIVTHLWQNKEEYKQISENALKWAKNFSWDRTKNDFLTYLKKRTLI